MSRAPSIRSPPLSFRDQTASPNACSDGIRQLLSQAPDRRPRPRVPANTTPDPLGGPRPGDLVSHTLFPVPSRSGAPAFQKGPRSANPLGHSQTQFCNGPSVVTIMQSLCCLRSGWREATAVGAAPSPVRGTVRRHGTRIVGVFLALISGPRNKKRSPKKTALMPVLSLIRRYYQVRVH